MKAAVSGAHDHAFQRGRYEYGFDAASQRHLRSVRMDCAIVRVGEFALQSRAQAQGLVQGPAGCFGQQGRGQEDQDCFWIARQRLRRALGRRFARGFA